MIEVELQQGREAYHRRDWTDAHAILSRVDQECRLGAEDLQRLAMAAYLTNRNDDCLAALERCYHAHRSGGSTPARSVPLSGSASASPALGEMGPANGWFARCARLLDGAADCVECGYLLLPTVEQQLARGDWDDACRDGNGGGRDRSAVRRTPIWWPARFICKGAR